MPLVFFCFIEFEFSSWCLESVHAVYFYWLALAIHPLMLVKSIKPRLGIAKTRAIFAKSGTIVGQNKNDKFLYL